MGVCPTALEARLDGVHGGVNAGRSCWVVASTICENNVQGMFAEKYVSCVRCDFYRKVKDEEGMNYVFSIELLKILSQQRNIFSEIDSK